MRRIAAALVVALAPSLGMAAAEAPATPISVAAALVVALAPGDGMAASQAPAAPIRFVATRVLHTIYHGQPRALQVDPSRIAVRWREASVGECHAASSTDPASRLGATPLGVPGWSLVNVLEGVTGTRAGETEPEAVRSSAHRIHARIGELLASPEVAFAAPVFHGEGGGWVTVTPEILMRVRADRRTEGRAVIAELVPDAAIVDASFGGMPGAYRLRSAARDGFEVLAEAARAARDGRVLWAEPDMLFTAHSASRPADARVLYLPNDPGFGEAWGIRNTGQFGGTPGMDMDGDVAWDVTMGSERVKVLVLDVGVQQDHPDLHLAHGADFTGQEGGGGPVNACDNHGTAVAGCIAAVIDNGVGTVGIAPRCPVLSARIGISDGSCNGGFFTSSSWTVYALAWGFVRGARVSNNSSGYSFVSSAIDDAYDATRAGGMVHFSAAGNGGPAPLGYPASLPTVLAVGALASSGTLADFSNHGPDVEVIAPGLAVFTTDRTGSPGWASGDHVHAFGTSFASPYAAGVAALIATQDTMRTADQIEDLLVRGCRDLGTSGHDPVYSHGLVNAATSLALGQAHQVGVSASPLAGGLSAAPNPFVKAVALRFTMPRSGRATLDVHDVTGRRVRRLVARELTAAPHRFEWDGRENSGSMAPAGLYWARLVTPAGTLTGRLVRLYP